MAVASYFPTGTVLQDRYEIIDEIGRGGFSVVYRARDRRVGADVAIKLLVPPPAAARVARERLRREVQAVRQLSHANIVPVYELGAEQGVYYIAMELCAGVSLAELLRAGPTSPAEGAYIGVEICRALDYAHRKAGIVHRDVTPRNVMIDAEGMVKVIDFGIASPASVAASGALFGSPGHMACVAEKVSPVVNGLRPSIRSEPPQQGQVLRFTPAR